ncbi:hypothetical protein NDU88_004744 [Pleurodeles waltl]|uniref:Uncharacterized protein n=1 Tax=Pleurodeles waltl TaxID=8319 RepID=A0AAV7RJ36_PLEWA|nr:hypothetical protein NDU88_004744 [Pleurodeles waltl]
MTDCLTSAVLLIRSGSYRTMPLSFWNVKHTYQSLRSPCGVCGQTYWAIPNINKIYKQDLKGVLNGYFSTNWGMATARGILWEALKVAIRGESLSKTYGIRKRLDQELTQQEDILAALQSQIENDDASELDCLAVRGRIVELRERLDNYVHRNYRQRLYQEGDRSGRMLAWLLQREHPVPFIQMLCGPSGEKILGQLRVNSHLREHLLAIYAHHVVSM